MAADQVLHLLRAKAMNDQMAILSSCYAIAAHTCMTDGNIGSRPGRKRRRTERYNNRPGYYIGLYMAIVNGELKRVGNKTDEDYRRVFRVPFVVLKELYARLRTHLKPHKFANKSSVGALECIALTMARLGITQNSTQWVDDTFGRNVATMHACIGRFGDALFKVFADEIRLPSRAELCESIAHYNTQRKFYPCAGAIDGKHFRIVAPADQYTNFKCYKGYTSVTMLAYCDHLYRFRWISNCYPGVNGDAGIWAQDHPDFEHLKIYDANIDGMNIQYAVIAGDAAFGLTPHVMRPYNRPELSAAGNHRDMYDKYNRAQSSARQDIENCWGHICKRFPIVAVEMPGAPARCAKIIHIICILHNLCKRLCVDDDDILDAASPAPNDRNDADNDNADADNGNANGNTPYETGQLIRTAIASHIDALYDWRPNTRSLMRS